MSAQNDTQTGFSVKKRACKPRTVHTVLWLPDGTGTALCGVFMRREQCVTGDVLFHCSGYVKCVTCEAELLLRLIEERGEVEGTEIFNAYLARTETTRRE